VTASVSIDAQQFLASCRESIDTELNRLIPKASEPPERVHAAIRWSVFAGGKRFRPALVIAVGETFGAPLPHLVGTACALEMIHTYSLIHDDLPAMDDDELRRGRATCHVQFDEGTAILAGDALLTLAFRTIAQDDKLSSEVRVRLIDTIACHAGTPGGMVAGQARDLAAEDRQVTKDELQEIHLEKTGALIRVAVSSGAIIAGATDEQINLVTHYALALGMLFQITDDFLDVTATAEQLGKTPGKDARARKASYPAILGLEATRAEIDRYHQAAHQALNGINAQTELLRSIADFIRHRQA
jgi:geranylgeranyl pyrophosphate synthase